MYTPQKSFICGFISDVVAIFVFVLHLSSALIACSLTLFERRLTLLMKLAYMGVPYQFPGGGKTSGRGRILQKCSLLFLRCSKHALLYNDFVISIQCIVCMSYNVYRFLLLPFFQLLLCFCGLICAFAAEK